MQCWLSKPKPSPASAAHIGKLAIIRGYNEMMQIQEIARDAKFEDSDSVRQALEKMRKVPEHELHFYLVARDTLQSTSADTRKLITLAQVEIDRRAALQTWCLGIITTIVSGVVGLVGVGLGAYLTN